MKYCTGNSSVHIPWIKDGLDPCFTDTVSTATTLGLLLIFGPVQYHIYKKRSARVDPDLIEPSFCSYLQIIVAVLTSLLALSRLAVQGLVLDDKVITGSMVLCAAGTAIAWMVTIPLVLLERRRRLIGSRSKRHGLLLTVFWLFAFATECLPFVSWNSLLFWWDLKSSDDKIEFGLWVGRITFTTLSLLIGFGAPGLPQQQYITMVTEDGDVEQGLPNVSNTGSRSAWSNFFSKVTMLWPYMWPKGHPGLQLKVLTCFLILAAGRGVNLLVPLYYKKIVDDLGNFRFCWDFIAIYVAMRFLQGGGFGSMGLLNNLRTFIWIRVQQYTTREIEIRLFSHLHNLSLRWHLGRKTGEVLRIMDRGTSSINNLLSYVLFSILPTIVDIIIAIVYFISAFNLWFGLIVFVTMLLYLVATIVVTEWRTKYRRDMNIFDNQRNGRGVDSLLNFETVKYYGAADFEVRTYKDAILNYQKAEFISSVTLNVLNSIQNFVITGGLLAGSLLCAWFISEKSLVGPGGRALTVGDYVLFASYVVQLYGPLNFFGTYYRMIQQAFIDMENMFDLLHEKQEVKDIAEAECLVVTKGHIKFDHVTFHYTPEKVILKDISFEVAPGQTVALVGHSGGGKSTIIRLLFRFYDITGGQILIDNQDISQVQQESVRKAIGVVPQDTVLFNNDIRYNIRYGRVTAKDEDIEMAANAADIHQRILTFPDGYETMVGERGLKLSGGEKQRVAIARTILKDPAFVLLDEATSALDTQTERNIQSSLAKVCENRTTIIVAHRLSTIIHANQILVLKEGVIVERGTHEELLEMMGQYYDMWSQQQRKAEDIDEGIANGDNVNNDLTDLKKNM